MANGHAPGRNAAELFCYNIRPNKSRRVRDRESDLTPEPNGLVSDHRDANGLHLTHRSAVVEFRDLA